MPELKIFLLGSPRAEVDGRPLEVDTRKALAILAYLAVGEPSHRRDALAGLLWPDYDPESARGALRRTLSSLRKALGGGWVRADRSVVSFDSRGAWVDAHEFRRLAAADGEASLRAAAGLYRGDFMEGFSLRDGFEFEDWQLYQADELRRAYAAVLERLVGLLEARGDLEEGLEQARRWLALDPLHEPAHRKLMSLYAAVGRRADALRQYRACVAVLDRELRVAPLPETSDLNERIMRDEVERPSPPAPVTRPQITAPPLIGRAGAWELLTTVYSSKAGSGVFVAVEGEAGVGKSRLVDAFADQIAESGAPVLRARCYEEEVGLAYAPVVDLLRAAHGLGKAWTADLGPEVAAEVARLVPEMPEADRPAWSDDPAAQRRFLHGLGEGLIAACSTGSAPGLLLIDDLHWADEASLDVVAYAARRLRDRPGMLLVTWRPEGIPPGHRMRRLLVRLKAELGAVSLALERLEEADVVELVAAVGIQNPGEVGRRLFEETEGLPLFVSGYLAAIGSRPAEESWSMPEGVRDALAARLGVLTDLGVQVIGAASAVGRSFDLDTVRAASGRSEEETVSGIEELRRAGLIDEVADVYDFDHELVRKFVYEQTSLARRRLLHRRIAQALSRRHRTATDGGRTAASIARHFHLAGREEDAAHFYRLAGEQARAVYANVEALSHLRDSLALGDDQQASLHESIGDVQTLLGEYSAAISSYEAAAARLPDGSRLSVLQQKIGDVHQRRGAYELAEAHLRAALDHLQEDDALAARIHAGISLAQHSDRRDEAALESAHRALELANAAGDGRAQAQTHNILGILWTALSRPEDARRHLRESLDLADRAGDPAGRVAALNNLALAARAAGDLDEAIALTEQGLELCVRIGDRHREAALHNNLADLLRAARRTDESMEHLRAAVAIFSEIGPPSELQPEIWKLVEW
jgi:DNA-binding SARP family transcriptional activator/predicted ATPase